MKFAYVGLALSVAIGACLLAAPAQAQATRTWVSGVGDDVNPCSRTAPCKTFAGAISKTAAGGEINCLDPGGFGAVTIVKSMYINCLYTEGGALAGGNGVTINAAATDVVVLRGLDLFGVNPPANGVRFVAGGALHVLDCQIRRFNAANSVGISFQPSGASELFVSNTYIAENGNGTTGGGILIKPTDAGSATVVLDNVTVANNAGSGIAVDGLVNVEMHDSTIAGNSVHGLTSTGGGSIEIVVDRSQFSGNGSRGVFSNGPNSIIRLGNSQVSINNIGLAIGAGGQLISMSGNIVAGNNANGTFTSTVAQK